VKKEFRKSFARSVRKWFGDLAVELSLQLQQVADGFFEIESPHFCLRIRASSGHSCNLLDLLVTLVPVEQRFAKFGSGRGEIGLGVIMEYYGDHLGDGSSGSTADNVDHEIKRLAQLTAKYCVPFLRGENSDWVRIREFLDQKIADKGIHARKYNLPKFVRQEWEVEVDDD
jgi:hypothetical protein